MLSLKLLLLCCGLAGNIFSDLFDNDKYLKLFYADHSGFYQN